MMATQSAVRPYNNVSDYSFHHQDWSDRKVEVINFSKENKIRRNYTGSELKSAGNKNKVKGFPQALNTEAANVHANHQVPNFGGNMPSTKGEWDFKGMEMLISYHQNPSIALRNKLVRLHAGLVRKVAHRIRFQCAEPYEDLEQIGYFGLIRAIERFDPTQGCAFSSFAVPYIRGEMLHFLRDKSNPVRIPRRWQELYSEGEKVQKQLSDKLGRTPKDSEIAQALAVPVQEWRESKLAVQNRLPLSLDATVSRQIDCPISLGETLPDTRYQAFQYLEEDRQQLEDALSQLEDKTRAAIECVFLRDLPRKEAAKQIGVSPMTVTRHLQKGVEQLVTLLQPQTAEIAS
jgi:RNA polymerase sigma-B factor